MKLNLVLQKINPQSIATIFLRPSYYFNRNEVLENFTARLVLQVLRMWTYRALLQIKLPLLQRVRILSWIIVYRRGPW